MSIRPARAGVLRFGRFVLDSSNRSLTRDAKPVVLRPKAFDVLEYLASRPGRLVSKSDLLDALWPDVSVGDSVLTTIVKQLRHALDVDRSQPSLIETAYGHGYRFAATIDDGVNATAPAATLTGMRSTNPAIVGRDSELRVLEEWFAQAAAGRRQIGFVVGEAGLGKTRLVDEFLDRLSASASDDGCLVARGQCLEQLRAGEPYLPVIEAIGELCAGPSGGLVRTQLMQMAPSWAGLLPAIGEWTEGTETGAAAKFTTPERMLREMASVLEALPVPLVLVLEDLHWSDYATVDLINRLANGRGRAALLLIGTWRAADMVVYSHPLKAVHRELLAYGRCRDLWLAPLAVSAVESLLRQRCPGIEPAFDLAERLHARADGNALFVLNLLDELIASGAFRCEDDLWTATIAPNHIAKAIPAGIHELITIRLERSSEADRTILGAGSVAGRAFTSGEVAAALERPAIEIEAEVQALATRSPYLHRVSEAATAIDRYEFTHSLYRDVLYDMLPPSQRRLLHARIAAALERDRPGRIAEQAISLARHYDSGGLPDRAVECLEEGAERASRFGAERDATAMLERAIAILDSLPRSPERQWKTIHLWTGLAQALQSRLGIGNDSSTQAFTRALRLGKETGDPFQEFQAALGSMGSYIGRAQFDLAREVGVRITELMDQLSLPFFVALGSFVLASERYHAGSLADARAYLDRCVDVELPHPGIFLNMRMLVLSYLALTCNQQGQVDLGRQYSEMAVREAENDHPFVRAGAAAWAFFARLHLRDEVGVEAVVEQAEAFGTQNGYAFPSALARFGRGWLSTRRQEFDTGIEEMRAAIAAFRTMDQRTALPALLATCSEAIGAAGRYDEALKTVADTKAAIASTGEIRYAAEILRIEGEIRMGRGDRDAALHCFREAITVASSQGALWWELRARVSLTKLLGDDEEAGQARADLAALLQRLPQEDESEDLRRARMLVAD